MTGGTSLLVAGQAVSLAPDGTFQVTVPLNPGMNVIELIAKASDCRVAKRVLRAGKFAQYSQGAGSIAGVAPTLSVAIDSPVGGATVTNPYVTVSGSVINSTGAETGVVVNGVTAMLSGTRFVANRVPVSVGDNTISVTATDANGQSATSTSTVSSAEGDYFRVTSNIDSGVAPLDLSLRLDASFPMSNKTLSVSGPVQCAVVPEEDGTYSVNLGFEGTYSITATAMDPNGQTHVTDLAIIVHSRSKLDTLLESKWNGMRAKIGAMDIDGAVQYLATPYRNFYRDGFLAVGTSLQYLNDYLRPIDLVYAIGERAKARMTRQDDVNGQIRQIEYVVYFIMENGIWKLKGI